MQESLLNIAEMAITMVGISALVAVFLSKGKLHPFDIERFVYVAMSGVLTALLAYLPIWLGSVVVDPVQIWQFASSACLVMSIATGTWLVLYEKQHPLPPSLVIPGSYTVANYGVGLTVLLLAIANIVGWPATSNGTIYEMTLFAILVHITIHFVGIAILRPE